MSKRLGRLVRRADGVEVEIGTRLTSFQGEEYVLRGWRKPHKLSSTGRVSVVPADDPDDSEQTFFPGVFDLEIVDFDL